MKKFGIYIATVLIFTLIFGFGLWYFVDFIWWQAVAIGAGLGTLFGFFNLWAAKNM